ncbi:MAG TPA: cytochrome c [Steroidobacteraceae bacterium]|nr:cytochrome c [Steroidobacteraceae bacterium]
MSWRAWLAVLLMCLGGCEQGRRDMYEQPKYRPLMPSARFADGGASRPLPADSIARARGTFAGTSSGRIGADEEVARARDLVAADNPYPPSAARLARGRDRYAIYCVPCHSESGDGDGPVVRRGFPAPPSFHDERLRGVSDRHIFDVISRGYGIMYPLGDRLAPEDRWAVVSYLRALQLSRHFPAERLPAQARARLEAAR